MPNNSRNSNLVASLLVYAIKNMNRAVDVINEQKDEFEDDEFFSEVKEHTSAELDDFVLDMATSDSYIEDTLEVLRDKGWYIIEKNEDGSSSSIEELVMKLVNDVGKKKIIEVIVDM